MKVIKATQQMLETRTLVLGFQGENLRTQLRIDCAATFAEYPNATPALAIKPPTGETYPIFVNRDGTEVVWDIVANNLALKGDGELQLTFYKDNVIAKTSIGHITVNRSLQIDGEMPDVVATWIENANRKLAEVDAQIVELEGMVDTATDAATRAEQSASTASTKAEQAAGSAATATEKATEATNAAGTATAKAAEAALSATQASNSAMSAADSERGATAKAGEATTAAGTATAKAEQATDAAQTATEKAGDASASATAAHASEINAAESADDALSAEVGANAAKRAAETSATQAGTSAQNAGTAAQTATQKAAEATQSATDAATSATNAATSAETASTKAGEAAQSAQAVAETAEQLAESLEQIDQNTQDIAELDERKANIDGYYPDMTVGNAEQLNSSKYVENSEPYTFRTSGGSADIGNREYLDAVVGGTLAWNQMVRDEASQNETDFAPIVTVTDAVEDAAGVKVKIEPVQDLHGYDHPWPAGGGVNKFDGEWESGNLNGTTGAEASNSSFSRSVNYIDVLPNTEYYIYGSGVTATTEVYVFAYKNDGTYINYTYFTTNGTYTAPVDCGKIRLQTRRTIETVLNYDFAVNYPSNVTTYSPYSNICPITGWDGVQVWDDPKHGGNIEWNQQARNYVSNADQQLTATYNGDGSFTITGALTANTRLTTWSITKVQGHLYLTNSIGLPSGAFCTSSTSEQRILYSRTTQSTIFECTATGTQGAIGINNRYGGMSTEFNGETVYCTLYDLTQMFGATKAEEIYAMEQANDGDGVRYFRSLFPASYYPYNAGEITTVSAVNGDPYRHYSITLPTEAGTVYGGTLDVVSGEGKVEMGQMVLNGTEAWDNRTGYSGLYSLTVPNIKPPASSTTVCDALIFDYLPSISQTALVTGTSGGAIFNWGSQIVVRLPDVTTLADFKAYLSEHPLTVVYPLVNPITYTLTASQIRTLLGTNNVWADTGDLALTYTGTDEHLTLESGKKYLSRISGTDSMLLGSGQEITAAKGTDNVFDLTQMFGTAVADYVYGQGAAFFRKWFGKQWYPYNAGELKHVEGLESHDMVGFNAWDEEWEIRGSASYRRLGSKNKIPVIPGARYFFNAPVAPAYGITYYKSDGVTRTGATWYNKGSITMPSDAFYMMFDMSDTYGFVYKNDICISLAHNGSRNGEYEPYEKHSYPLDSSVILRGIPKVGANGVYWDGDRYLPDGTVERRYAKVNSADCAVGAYSAPRWLLTLPASAGDHPQCLAADVGNIIANGFKTVSKQINSAAAKYLISYSDTTYVRQFIFVIDSDIVTTVEQAREWVASHPFDIVYELATPTIEQAQPYHSTQWVSDWGTEEFVSTSIVPVGHETRYPANLRDKLQHLPDAASGNGSYLITQTDGQMVLTPFPAPPSSAGNYVLKATVVNGVATYTWEVAT